jgi:hypothetical protein
MITVIEKNGKFDAYKVFFQYNQKEGKAYIKEKAKELGIKVPWYLTAKTERRVTQIIQKHYLN